MSIVDVSVRLRPNDFETAREVACVCCVFVYVGNVTKALPGGAHVFVVLLYACVQSAENCIQKCARL